MLGPHMCIDCGTTTNVCPRWPGYGYVHFLRCQACGDARVEREEGNIERNFQAGSTSSTGPFDAADAGEAFESEDC